MKSDNMKSLVERFPSKEGPEEWQISSELMDRLLFRTPMTPGVHKRRDQTR